MEDSLRGMGPEKRMEEKSEAEMMFFDAIENSRSPSPEPESFMHADDSTLPRRPTSPMALPEDKNKDGMGSHSGDDENDEDREEQQQQQKSNRALANKASSAITFEFTV
jgi:hypothetical protein